MATKTLLFEAERVGDTIIAAQKLTSFETVRFDLEVYGPDDRRADEAIRKDASLRKDLAGACEKAFAKYKEEVGKYLAGEEKAYGKLSGEARTKFADQFSGYDAISAAFKKMESAGVAETKKRWAKVVAADPTLKTVRFEAVYVPFIARFTPIRDAEKEAPEDFDASKEVGPRLREARTTIEGLPAALAEAVKSLDDSAGLVQSINETIDAAQKDYDAGPRESQKDDPGTEGAEEPDETKLDAAIYAEHGKALQSAEGWYVTLTTNLFVAARDSAEAAKALTAALKKISTSARQNGVAKELAADLVKTGDKVGALIREFVAIESESKATRRDLEEGEGIIRTVAAKKPGALGLIGKARITAKLPTAKLTAAVKTLREIKVPLPR